MSSGAEQLPNTSGVSSSHPFTERTINCNGQEIRVIQLQNFRLRDIENQQQQALETKKHMIPPSEGTPVNALPNELLSYVFTLGSGAEEDGDDVSEEGEDDQVPMDEPGPPIPFKVLVSHVCRRWRMVAIETSTLWTHLDFAEGPPFDKSRTWIERSKECPLDIELDCTVDGDMNSNESDDQADSSSSDDLVAPEDRVPPPIKAKKSPLSGLVSPVDLPVVRDLILPHAARWRIFELSVNDFQIMYGILSTLASIPEAPQLQALQLYHYDDKDDDDHFSPPHLKQPFAPFCGRAPNLTQVALWGVHVDWASCAFLQGLEELELAYHARDVRPPFDIFARILRGSPDLHILTLCASGPAGDPEDWPADVIELPSVKHLVLAFIEPSYASALMKRLVFPNLSTLALDFDAGDYSSFLVQLARPAAPTQRRPLCQNLVDLKVSGMHCSEPALAAFYAALPNLAALNLNCYHLPREFFRYLYPGLSGAHEIDGCYLPKLETLTTTGIDGTEMLDLLTQRTAVPLKHVQMDSEADVDVEEEARLRKKVETFGFFDGSDDEDDDDDDDDGEDVNPFFTTLDTQQLEMAALAAEDDGVPGEWVDDDP